MEFLSHLSIVKTPLTLMFQEALKKHKQTKKTLCFYSVYSQNVQGQTNFHFKKIIYFLSLDLWGIHATELKAKDHIPSLKKIQDPAAQ